MTLNNIPASCKNTQVSTVSKSPQKIAALFDSVARRYDLYNWVASVGLVKHWRGLTTKVISPRTGMAILDAAGGTGSSAAPLAAKGASVIVIDISPGMLEAGRNLHKNLEFTDGDVTAIPFADERFDVVTISFGLRNVDDVGTALKEFFRILKPGGRLVVTEFSHPQLGVLRALFRFYLKHWLPLVGHAIFGKTAPVLYLSDSILQWPNQGELAQTIALSGFRSVRYRNVTAGIVAIHEAYK
jgi:demethylmenaquinone methyltransferase/2-methoxy-6-polyprenyl-1,4-benzoquinol methylase